MSSHSPERPSEAPPELQGPGPSEDELARERRASRRFRIIVSAVASVLALALVGYGLSPLLFSRDEAAVEPGPLPTEPGDTRESFGEQQPEWWSCEDDMLCADVHAPVDWTDLAGERITLRLVKQEATGGEALGTLFVNPGGPGASGVEYVANSIDSAVQPEVQAKYDVVGWDPRGVGASTAVTCLEPAALDEFLFGGDEDLEDLEVGSDEWLAAAAEESRAFGDACAESTGELIGFVDTASTVQDLDMLRAIVGDDRLNYLGYSYGTYIGARYADAYPERVGRFVLDGAIDPQTTQHEVVREQTRGFELALRAYAADCLERNDCPFEGTVDDAMAEIGAILDAVEETPVPGDDGRTLYVGTLLTSIVTPLYSPDSWSFLDLLFEEVAEGEADTAFWLADFYYGREDGRYVDNSFEAFIAINCLDYPAEIDAERMRAEAEELEEVAPTIGRFQGYGDVGCAEWPASSAEERGGVDAVGADAILVVGTTGDPATPYRWAESLADQLESGTLVTYEGEGHTAYGKSACVNGVVNEYLLTGAVPSEDPVCGR